MRLFSYCTILSYVYIITIGGSLSYLYLVKSRERSMTEEVPTRDWVITPDYHR